MRLLRRAPTLLRCTLAIVPLRGAHGSSLLLDVGRATLRQSSTTVSAPPSTSESAQGVTPDIAGEDDQRCRVEQQPTTANASIAAPEGGSADPSGAFPSETLPPLEPDEELLIKATGTSEKRLPRAVSTRERLFQREEWLAKENGTVTDYLEIGAGSSVFRQTRLKEMPTENSRAERDPWPEADRKKDLPSYFKERRTSPFLPPTEAQDNKPDLLHDPKKDIPYPVYMKVIWVLMLIALFFATTSYDNEPLG